MFRLFLDLPSEIRLVMPEVLGILELLGSVWRTLGSREELGAISCAVLGPMGVILATLWLHIGILWGSWGDFGPIWAPWGAHLATLWSLLAPFGPLRGDFGPIWAPWGAHLATLWLLLAPFGPLLETFCIKKQRTNKNNNKKHPQGRSPIR